MMRSVSTRWMRTLLGSSLALLVGCTVPPASSGSRTLEPRAEDVKRGTFDGITLTETVVAPSGAAAQRYGDTPQHALNPTETVLVQSMMAQLKLEHSPALSKMTRELARTAPDRTTVPPALVDGLMAWAGLVHPSPRLVSAEIAYDPERCARGAEAQCAAELQPLIAEVGANLSSPDAMFGVGVARPRPDRTRLFVAVLEPAVELEPIARSLPAGQSVRVAGRLRGSRSAPRVEVVGSKGDWGRIATTVSVDGSFSATVPCTDRGAQQIEVLADGEHGPEVVANFPVFCGTDAPDAMTVEVERVSADVSPEQVARANFAYLNAERERRGLEPLQWSDEAADIARAHSRDMVENRFVGHRSPSTGDVTQRFVRGGLRGTIILENVARGYGPKGIHDSLMSSPGHRINILSPDVTHVGIGVVIAEPESDAEIAPRPIFATQNFFRKPGAGAPADGKLVPSLQAKIDRSREARGLPPVDWDRALMKVADEVTRAHAEGKKVPAGFEKKVFAEGYTAVETVQARSADFDALATVDLWTQKDLHVGLGIRRVSEGGDEAFLMVVLVAER